MTNASASPSTPPPFGRLLKRWRGELKLSQHRLALAAGISSRHLSFVETGRARPSRDMVVLLGETMGIPFRARNALLLAAGFAPLFEARPLSEPEMSEVDRAIDFLLARHEPFSAILIDSAWNILRGNRGHERLLPALLRGTPESHITGNLMRLLMHPRGIRTSVLNWPVVARLLIGRLEQEAEQPGAPPELEALWQEVKGYEGVGALTTAPPAAELGVLIPVTLSIDSEIVSVFTTVTTLAAPLDITLQELRIETYFPADADSERVLREVWDAADSPA